MLRPCIALLVLASTAPASALQPTPWQAEEEADQASERRLIVTPERLDLMVGDEAVLELRLEDAEGNEIDEPLVVYSRARRSVMVDSDGNVEALEAGDHVLVVRSRRHRGERIEVEVPVHVRPLPLDLDARPLDPAQ
jgi:hypothetical protein